MKRQKYVSTSIYRLEWNTRLRVVMDMHIHNTQAYNCNRVGTHAHEHLNIRIIRTHTPTRIHISMHTNKRMHTRTLTHTRQNMHTHAHMHVHIHVHVHIKTKKIKKIHTHKHIDDWLCTIFAGGTHWKSTHTPAKKCKKIEPENTAKGPFAHAGNLT